METKLRFENGHVQFVEETLKTKVERALSRVKVTKAEKRNITRFVEQTRQLHVRHHMLVINGAVGSGKTYVAMGLLELCAPGTTIMIDEGRVFGTFTCDVKNMIIVSSDIQSVQLKVR